MRLGNLQTLLRMRMRNTSQLARSVERLTAWNELHGKPGVVGLSQSLVMHL